MSQSSSNLDGLYRAAAPALLAFFRRQRALAANAEDLLHDTFVRAMRQQARLDASVSPRAYLFGIARHVGLDALRRQRLAPTEIEPASPETGDSADPRLEALRTEIAQLPETHREPLLLKLQQELSYEEIAEVLDLPIGTVRSRLHHAVRRLKEALNPASAARPFLSDSQSSDPVSS